MAASWREEARQDRLVRAQIGRDRETARTLMQQGRELTAKGDLKEALKRFKGADDIMHVPTTGLEVARTQAPLGLLVEARDTIARIRPGLQRKE